ncbi:MULTISPECIES: SIS domain-containing protein [unclassified Campylobacter]|uniref:KpsF/GutQ family sugar-phosphate isomerase n=1 Tax=unclassified Campylobacter TaxID=2593542 RepID=UPI001237B274|nr:MULTISPECIES: KpsF/GutQ family sugar-phosphate isomerase [unclassified Campylobacter]KAA6225155.1 KpsF/GutQ family sugar-phosphate isomerase [Campylobacter sp. LR196d]KAA6226169.1 KpsF/GutQ family sugar-phosphate isomerase [Campylobacter sp. LR185c]KAA6228117.1 KpsF/GutQ family sugar-phosphate isomerase [Campylobacter sp. LR286c]KAA6231370.1 KpsF/GutQ family sugar-phosphate isomerase [Campylobacter sp. LR264d]KAA6231581.1 KpsF/GutQ family sugar-phosphate isomerase [Campylobacter sp. LR291e]
MDALKIAKEVFEIEAKAILDLSNKLDDNFTKVVDLILNTKGRCIISGMGKSGHIATKIAATLASTGTPSFFLHPSEALHGDLGMLTPADVLISISNSGETEELLKIIPAVKRRQIKLIVMTGNIKSTLAKQGDIILNISVEKEACPLQLAPMSSTTATLAMGDALAAALMKAKKFKPDDFALFHPGGSLGRKLLTKVKDVMVSKNLPIVNPNTEFNDLVDVMTSGKLGLCIVVENEKLVGIITDGDLRRALKGNNRPRFDFKAQEIMSKNPKLIDAEAMATEAEELMIKNKIKEIVVSHNEKIVGIIQLYAIGSL